MKIPIYSPVTLLSDKYLKNGVKAGDYGVIVDIYEDGYEVDFLDEEGNTINCFGVEIDEVKIAENLVQKVN